MCIWTLSVGEMRAFLRAFFIFTDESWCSFWKLHYLDAGLSLRQITAELNEEGVPTARGGQWHLTSVKRLVDRLAA